MLIYAGGEVHAFWESNNTREVGINADVSFTTQKFCFFDHTRKGILLRN